MWIWRKQNLITFGSTHIIITKIGVLKQGLQNTKQYFYYVLKDILIPVNIPFDWGTIELGYIVHFSDSSSRLPTLHMPWSWTFITLVSSYYFSSIADSLFQVGSIYSTLALSVERYLAVVHPFTVYRWFKYFCADKG